MPTVLKYPKKQFSKREVLSSTKSFKFKKAWVLGSTKKDWTLTFTKARANKYYRK